MKLCIMALADAKALTLHISKNPEDDLRVFMRDMFINLLVALLFMQPF